MKKIEKRIRLISYGSLGLLGLLACLAINPSAKNRSFATCVDGVGDGECAVSAMSQEIGVTTKTAITLAIENQVKLPDITPTSKGATSYASTKLAVATNSKEGYSIFLQTGTDDGDLVGVTSGMDDTSKIANTTKNGVTLSNLENDSYGYALSTTPINDSSVYSHVPTSSTVVYNKPGSAGMGAGTDDYPYGDEYYLAFGTKIGTTLPAGTYSGTVTVSAVANPLTVTSLYDISTMQQMTSSICENTKEHYTKQLADERDGKSYWVAKLKDGNCWMTQNLALNLDVDANGNAVAVAENGKTVVLDDTNTDVSEVWSNYAPDRTENSIPIKTGSNYSSSRSWNLGNIILTNPTTSTRCADVSTGGDITSCQWYQNVDGMMAGYTAAESSSISPDGKSYDSHYLIGNYYQWNTATAGSGILTDEENKDNSIANTDASEIVDATSSICPRGWKLPTSGRYWNGSISYPFERNGSFMSLLVAYGYPKGNIDTGWNTNNGSPNTTVTGNTKTRPDFSPMFFVHDGDIDPTTGTFRYASYAGFSWSSSAVPASTSYAYDFDFNTSLVYLAGFRDRYRGFSVRCLAE